jgi:predicted dienelactone hydrolase
MFPSPNSESAPKAVFEQTGLHRLKGLLKRFFHQTKGFIAAKTLPRLADKTCQLYFGDVHPTRHQRCRRLLRSQIHLDPHQLQHFFQSELGDTLLGWLERFFLVRVPEHASPSLEPSPHAKRHALKNVLTEMASEPTGLSLLSFAQRFPHQLQLNLDEFLALVEKVEQLLQETDATIARIRELAAAEAADEPLGLNTWPDLTQSGPYQVVTSNVEIDSPIGAKTGGLQVVYYQPCPWPQHLAPVVLQSHGLASSPEDLSPYARYLASYGYFVAALRHSGSDSEQLRRLLAGEALDVLQLQDFVHRPRQVSHVLDVLTHDQDQVWHQHLNLNAVGVFGHSFGAYTALALAGATIELEHLKAVCHPVPRDPNLSLLLQCQALGLPHQTYRFRDHRVAAIVCLDAIGSEVFKATGIGHIQIPVLLVAGSQDTTAPLVFEQMRIFQWLQAPRCYLALMHGKSHMRDIERLIQTLNLQLKIMPKTMLSNGIGFDNYINAVSLAFLQEALSAPGEPRISFNAAYTKHLSQAGIEVSLISHRSK